MSNASPGSPDARRPPNQESADLPLNTAPKGSLLTIFLIVFLDMMGFGIIIPLLPRYIPDYEQNPLKVTLIFSIYSICQFIGAPLLGLISDRWGRRPVLVLSQVGSALGYVLLGVATDWGHYTVPLIYLSRVIDGFTGGNISTAQAYVSDITTPQNRARGMGMLGAAFGFGFALGPAIGGVLGEKHTSLPAYLAAVLALVAAVQSALRIKDTRTKTPAQAEVWLHPNRFVPVLKKPVLVQLLIISFCIMSAFVMMESTLVLYLGGTFGFGVRTTGWFFFFLGLIIIIVQGGLVGRLTRQLGEWPLAIIGPLLVALGMVGLVRTAYAPLLVTLMFAGALNSMGRSLQQPVLSSLLSKFSDRGEQGVVFGLFHGLGSLARVVGPLVAGLMYPYLKHTGQFALAGVIAVLISAWTVLLRQPAPTAEDAIAPGAIEAGAMETA